MNCQLMKGTKYMLLNNRDAEDPLPTLKGYAMNAEANSANNIF